MYLSDLAKILSLAAVLNRLSKDETRGSLIALAWTLRNREINRRQTSKFSKSTRTGMTNTLAGKAVVVRPWNILTLFKPAQNQGYCRSLAIVSLVWCGEEADPTAGATHFHRHDDWPEWALSAEPVALIGSWFFYNEIDTQP